MSAAQLTDLAEPRPVQAKAAPGPGQREETGDGRLHPSEGSTPRVLHVHDHTPLLKEHPHSPQTLGIQSQPGQSIGPQKSPVGTPG